MESLAVFVCLLATSFAKPDTPEPISYGPHLVSPSYSYSTYLASSPIYHGALATPLAHFTAAQVTSLAPINVVEKTQYHSQNELGQASYGHSEPLQTHNAVQDIAGNKVGSYSYIAPDGQIISTNYIADNLGFRVASNAVPVAPTTLPVGPSETPEVLAARAAHLKAHEIIKSRSRRSIPIGSPLTYTGLTPFTYSAHSIYPAPLVLSQLAPLGTVNGHSISYTM